MPWDVKDASIFTRDGVLAVASTGQSAKVHLDFPEEVEDFGSRSLPGQVAGFPRITYSTAELTLVFGTTLEVGGVPYKVKWTRQIGDGVFSQAELQKQ